MRRFEFVGGGSSKFWEISQSGSEVTVHFGRIGTNGQTQTKGHDSWEDASERVRKLVAEKLKEGYQEVAGSGPRPETEPGFRKPPAFPPYELQTLAKDRPASEAAPVVAVLMKVRRFMEHNCFSLSVAWQVGTFKFRAWAAC